jgi:HK97 family phage portal protein
VAGDGLGEVVSLWLLDPTCMEVEFNGRDKRFVYTQDGVQRIYSIDDVLHIVGFGMSGLWGDSRVEQAKQALGTAIARAKFEGGFYKRGARNPAVIEYPGRLGEDATAKLKAQFDLWHAGVENMHKVPILEEGARFNAIGQSLEDMQFSQLAQQTRTDIAVLFGVPPAYLGGSTGDSLTYATTESNQIQFAQMAVAPVTTLIAKALSGDPAILPWNVMYAEFVLEGLLRADMRTRSEYWKTMKEVLGLDPEYIASRENIPRDALKEPEPVPVQLQPAAPEAEQTDGEVVPLPTRPA